MKIHGIVWILLTLGRPLWARFQDGFTFKTSICEGKDGALLPMFGTCRGYYICNNGNAVVGSCDEISRFNPITLHCDEADNVDCMYDDEKANKVTVDKQVDSQEFQSVESDEAEDEEDDDEEEEELELEPVTTVKPKKRPQKQKANSNNICLGKRNGYALPKTDSCSDYYVCKSQRSQLRSCPGQQQFSPTRRLCLRASEAKCQVSEEPKWSPPVMGGFCSDETESALVPHANDCSKFMLCSNMMFLVMDCPSGLHFNAENKRCDYPKIAKCQEIFEARWFCS
ncbi:chondroitin proteoglycan 2 [Drosophila tropicalis]|uniref:chondroitin proteoglycan 2 n=1 Tax=Drosophila tropicalis TaxID=46794 RepID=UPI0035ABD855